MKYYLITIAIFAFAFWALFFSGYIFSIFPNPVCKEWICNWDSEEIILTCIRDEPCSLGGNWIADTGVYKGSESVSRTVGFKNFCDGYKEFLYVPPRKGSECCRWNPGPDMTCFLDDGKIGMVTADSLETRCGRYIGCAFTGTTTGTILTVDLSGQLKPTITEPGPITITPPTCEDLGYSSIQTEEFPQKIIIPSGDDELVCYHAETPIQYTPTPEELWWPASVWIYGAILAIIVTIIVIIFAWRKL